MVPISKNFKNECETIYFNHNEHYRAKIEMETREERFNKWLENKFPNKTKKRSNPILQHFRSIKDPIELELIQKACDITNKGSVSYTHLTLPTKA